MNLQKENAWRSQKYLDWVKQQPSCVSRRLGCDAHHIKGNGFGGTTTAPDWAAIPLTREEHAAFHTIGWQTWESLHGTQLGHVAKILSRAFAEGIITIKGAT